MRGKVPRVYFSQTVYRITPAYAGKSVTSTLNHLENLDHPRLCGEKLRITDPILRVMGSPPPMRGKAKPDVFPSMPSRITPAYAGKSDWCSAFHEFY